MARASAFEAVDFGLIPNLVYPMTAKLVFTFLLDAQHERDSVAVANKRVSLLVWLVRKAISEIRPSWCGIQVTGNF